METIAESQLNLSGRCARLYRYQDGLVLSLGSILSIHQILSLDVVLWQDPGTGAESGDNEHGFALDQAKSADLIHARGKTADDIFQGNGKCSYELECFSVRISL